VVEEVVVEAMEVKVVEEEAAVEAVEVVVDQVAKSRVASVGVPLFPTLPATSRTVLQRVVVFALKMISAELGLIMLWTDFVFSGRNLATRTTSTPTMKKQKTVSDGSKQTKVTNVISSRNLSVKGLRSLISILCVSLSFSISINP